MSDKEMPEQEGAFLADLGITDRVTGLARARASRELLLQAGKHVLGSAQDYTIRVMVFSGLLARAQGFHEGSVAAIEADNPYAAFTLLRAYAENAASILYLKDRPTILDQFWRPETGGVSIGRVKNHAKKRFAGFDRIYSELRNMRIPGRFRRFLCWRQTGSLAKTAKRWSGGPRRRSTPTTTRK